MTQVNKEEVAFFEVYKEYAGHLRTWLVGYGVGLPALILSNQHFYDLLSKAGNLRFVGIFIMCGLLPQVVLAIANKYLNWISYWGELDKVNKKSKIYLLVDGISEWIIVDFLVDIITIVCYISGTWLIFQGLLF